MKWALAALITIHGLIHFMGVAKAFGLTDIPQLQQPISRGAGVLWLLAALAMLAAAVLLVRSPRLWWWVGLAAVVLSQAAIVTSWGDAKFGTIANLIVLVAVAYGFASQGPWSLRAEYRRAIAPRLGAPVPERRVTESDLEPLPDPVRRYVRASGAVGRPHVRDFRVTWTGRIRGTADDSWMEFTARQHNFVEEPARFFLMDARRRGLPVDVLHEYREAAATMRARVLSLIPIVNQRGPELTRAETVTLFNDLALLASGALVDADIGWEPIDDRSARGRLTVGDNTVTAVLSFNEDDELVDFVSDDRLQSNPDGGLVRQRWSTPVAEYRDFGPLRVMSRGEGRWHPPEGAFTYFEGRILDVEMNPECR